MERKLALVTGASGAVGPVLVRGLVARGYRVRAMAGRGMERSLFPAGVEVTGGDICDDAVVRDAVRGADVVFHLAARLHTFNPSEQLRPQYERTNVDGTRLVMDEARRAGAGRVVFFSTIGVYGPTGREPVDERMPPSPDTIYSETKLAAERVVLEAERDNGDGKLGLVLRLAAVYGPRMKGNYARLVAALRRRRFIRVGAGENFRTLVYDVDVARAAMLAAEVPAAAGGVYNVSDGTLHSFGEIVDAICEALGQGPPRLGIPLGAARGCAAMADRLAALGGRSASFSALIDKLVENVAVDSSKVRTELGFEPRYDLRRGWQETCALLSGQRIPENDAVWR